MNRLFFQPLHWNILNLFLLLQFVIITSVFADGSISASAAKTNLLIHEETSGTISVTLPDKPVDTDEIHYLGDVTINGITVSGAYTPFSTSQNPNPESITESGVTLLSSTSFKFIGNKAGTWKETFKAGFSSLSTEVL